MTSVSTSGFYDGAIFNMNSLQSQINDLQTSISTGNKFQQASQDPTAAAQMRSLQAADALATADTANAQSASASLSQADTTLSQISNTVEQIQTLATQAANGTLTDSQRGNIGAQIGTLYTSLVSLANSQTPGGAPLFGGTGSGNAYTVDAAGNATYAGTANAPTLSLGAGLNVTTGVTGPQVFNFSVGGTATNVLSVVQNLAAALQGNVPGTTPQAAAQASLSQLSAGLGQTLVGARQNWVTTTTSIQTALSTQRATQESDVGGTDIATAVAKLSQASTVLQAAQASFVKVAGMSLFAMLQ